MDDISEKTIEAGTYQYNDPTDLFPPYDQITAPDLGNYDIGDFLDKNGKSDAIMSLWGAVKHSNLITADDIIPVLLIHGTTDDIVPFGIGSPFNVQTFPPTYGSDEINNKLGSLNFINKETYFVAGEGHEFYGVSNGMWSNGTGGNAYWGIIVDKAVNFFYQQHKPEANFSFAENNLEVTFTNTSTDASSWLWEFGDINTSTEENPVHAYVSAGTYQVKLYIENSINSWDTISYNITVSDISGINNIVKDFFKIYPNPASETIHIDIQDITSYDLQISDITGKILFNQSVTGNKYAINISDYKPGIYIIRLENNKEILTKKIIIK